jgi:hypothetical protein
VQLRARKQKPIVEIELSDSSEEDEQPDNGEEVTYVEEVSVDDSVSEFLETLGFDTSEDDEEDTFGSSSPGKKSTVSRKNTKTSHSPRKTGGQSQDDSRTGPQRQTLDSISENERLLDRLSKLQV